MSPPSELRNFVLWEEQQLQTYGWVNRSGGIVRIPVDRAMDLVLERGLRRATARGHNRERER